MGAWSLRAASIVAEWARIKPGFLASLGMTKKKAEAERNTAMRVYHIYILCSASGVLYTGVTNDLECRVIQHKSKVVLGFTQRYDITRLVYFEAFGDIRAAIAREKEIKGWRREKKLALIRGMNPGFRDLSKDFHR